MNACPICNKPLNQYIISQEGTVEEECYSCPTKHYINLYAYGNISITVGNEIFYLFHDSDNKKFNKCVNEAIEKAKQSCQ